MTFCIRKVITNKQALIATSCLLLLSACVTIHTDERVTLNISSQEKAEARIELGIGYLQQGNLAKARENFEKALQHTPDYYRAQLSLAHYHQQVGEYQYAENLYRKTLALHPNNGNVLNNYGTFLCKQGNFTAAEGYFKQAIKQPRYYSISASYENAAFCAIKSGDINKAMLYFSRAIDYEPTRHRAVLNLAKLEISQSQLNEARLRLFRLMQTEELNLPVKRKVLTLMIALETKADNATLVERYQQQLAAINT